MYTKICKQCGTEGPLDLFQRDISKRDKVRPECKECTAANRKKRYNPSKNRMHTDKESFDKLPDDDDRWMLYKSPPSLSLAQRKPWVGLTDEDISKMPAWIYSPDQDGMTAEEGLEVFARAIEAKLREKNTE